MGFGLEQQGGSLITPMALVHPRPLEAGLRLSDETCGLDDVLLMTLVLVHKFNLSLYIITYYRCCLSNRNTCKFFLRDVYITKSWCDHDGVSDDAILSSFLFGFNCISIV